jgi:micrococcal nuclease
MPSLCYLILLPLIPLVVFGYRRLAYRGIASRIEDGDGFTLQRRLLPSLRIRIAWIDAPEKGQPFADQARAALRELIAGKNLRISGLEKDVFGRQVAQVWVDRCDVGLALVERGAAWYYRHYASRVSIWRRWRYAGAERRARSEKRGLWAQKRPEAPWDFKHRPWWRKLLFS